MRGNRLLGMVSQVQDGRNNKKDRNITTFRLGKGETSGKGLANNGEISLTLHPKKGPRQIIGFI